MKSEKIPDEILAKIHAHANEEWPDDQVMQEHVIDSETQGYLTLQAVDFGGLLAQKEQLLKAAEEYGSLWEERAEFIVEEVEAFAELQGLAYDDVPADVVVEIKQKAVAEHNRYADQIYFIRNSLSSYYYVRETREKIGPIRDLLVQLEGIIGAECYNANIQNYSAWGIWEGEGRSFRYPVTFIKDGEEEKRRSRTGDLDPEVLITGHYKFGANELSIYRALVRVIDLLEKDYGLKVPTK